jgi:hypothetical protein
LEGVAGCCFKLVNHFLNVVGDWVRLPFIVLHVELPVVVGVFTVAKCVPYLNIATEPVKVNGVKVFVG